MELGSEFHLDFTQLTDTPDTVFTYLKDFHTVYTDSGRSALRLLSGQLMGETVLVPDYICGSVRDALPKGCHIVEYPLDRQLCIEMEALERLIREHSPRFLYLMHYFGTLQPDSRITSALHPDNRISRLAQLKETYHLTVIEDMTHALFTAKSTIGDYGVASLRKWFPIPDGGVLYTADRQLLPEPPRQKKAASKKVEAMLLKNLYLTQGYDCHAKYREIFVKEEEAFGRQTGVYGMSEVAAFLLSHFPVASMCKQRRKNTAQLLEGLHRLGYAPAVAVKPSDVLLALPVYVTGRDALRAQLINKKIYCAIHWPLEHPAVYEGSRWVERHILSLPIDQRYREDGMEYLLGCLQAGPASKPEKENMQGWSLYGTARNGTLW